MLRALVPFVRPAVGGYGSSSVLLCRGANTNVVSASYSSGSKNSNSHKKNEIAKMRLRNKHKHKSSSSVSTTPITKTKTDTTTEKDATKPIHVHAKVEFKGKRARNITTNTMAMAARAHARQQRRMLGDKSLSPSSAREQVLAELYEQVEGSTIHVSKEEFDADPSTLSFDQLYRRILRTFEEQGSPKKQLLFEMLKRAKAKEDWDNFLIIAKIYQSKLIMFKPREASHLVQIAVNQGFATQMLEEMVKNVWFVYPTKAGYHRLIVALLKLNTPLDKCLALVKSLANKDVQPYRESFKQMIHHFAASDVSGAFKLYKLSSAIGVRTTSVEAYELARKLAEKEQWADIIELEKIAKHDNPDKQFRSLTSLIFVNARVKTGDSAGAQELTSSSSASLKEDLASLAEADRTAFPFLNDLVQTFPQLA